MTKWLRGFRGTILMILTWTVGWGLGFGGIMEIIDPNGKIADVWPTLLAIPGFVGGVVFAALLTFAERGRSYADVSFTRFVTLGVATGIVVGLIPVIGKVGDVSPGNAVMFGIGMGLSIVAAIGAWVFMQLLSRASAPARTGTPVNGRG